VSRRRRAAFTLVELLVVIGIISVLTAVLLPALRTARLASQRVACASNLRQIGTAVLMYVNENRQHLPMVIDPLWSSGASPNFSADPFDPLERDSLPNVLMRHLRSSNVYTCPSAVLGYPTREAGMSYRASAANNLNGIVQTEEQLTTPALQYNFNLKYLNGRIYRLRHAEFVSVGGFPQLKLIKGPGPYYLLRDLVQYAPGLDRHLTPHKERFNQLKLDISVALEKDSDVALTYP
jgi:prepilin-type N-terminal cleavage/methylation domain-containing protein